MSEVLCWGGVPSHDRDGNGRCMTCGHKVGDPLPQPHPHDEYMADWLAAGGRGTAYYPEYDDPASPASEISKDPGSAGAPSADPAPGSDPGAGCPECGGTGTVVKSDPPHEFANQYQEPCPVCRPDLKA
jgi:hypothetical protein